MSNLFCLVCSKSFPETELSGHVASVHFGFLSFACTSCDFTAAQEAEVLQHADKEGHIPFVVDRSNTKPYLTSLSKLIVGHCKVFSASKNFAGILTGLDSQIAADLNQLDGTKSEIQIVAVHDSETSSERSVSTPQSTSVSNLKPDTDACHSSLSSVASSLPENPSSRPVDTPKSNKSIEPSTPVHESSTTVHDNLTNDVLPVQDQVTVSTLCALCASNEAFSVDQREGHVFQHLDRNETALSSSSSNPAEYFSELAQMWQRCFPSLDPVTDTNSNGQIKASPERHVTKANGTFQTKTHVTCLQCSKLTWKSAKSEHVWQQHMSGFDRYVCTICGSKGMRKDAVLRDCAALHAGILSEFQPFPLTSQAFDQQFQRCFGHLPLSKGRPPGRSLTSSTRTPAAIKPINDASSSEEIGRSEERRYPTTRRSLNVQVIDSADSPRLSPKVRSSVLKRLRRRDLTSRLNRSMAPVVTSKALKRRTELDSSSETRPGVSVPDLGKVGRARLTSKAPRGQPKMRLPPAADVTLCGLCQSRLPKNVGYASHVWIRHMHGFQRLACAICDATHNFRPSLLAECAIRHPDSESVIKVVQSPAMIRKYEQQYLQCFGTRPSTNQGFFKPAKPKRSGLGGGRSKVSMPNQAKFAPVKVAANNSKSANHSSAKCQLCSLRFKYDVSTLRRHALRKHFGSVVFECSECGYGRKTDAYQVANHVRQMHPGDKSVRVVDHTATYANEIQQCLDSCFPDIRLSAVSTKWKRKQERESSPLFSKATIETDFADVDQPGTSGYAAIEVGEAEGAEEMEQSGFASNFDDENDDENEDSLALVKQELLLQSGHMQNAVVAISSADVAAALKNVAVKTEEIDDVLAE